MVCGAWSGWRDTCPGPQLMYRDLHLCDDRHMCRNLSFAGEAIIIGGWMGSRVVASTPATSSSWHVADGDYTRTHAGSGQAPKDPATESCRRHHRTSSWVQWMDRQTASYHPPNTAGAASLSLFYHHHDGITPGSRAF